MDSEVQVKSAIAARKMDADSPLVGRYSSTGMCRRILETAVRTALYVGREIVRLSWPRDEAGDEARPEGEQSSERPADHHAASRVGTSR